MNKKLENLNANRQSVFVGEMPDETLCLELNGEKQYVRVLGRFCVRAGKINGNYVVVLVNDDDKEDVVIFKWLVDKVEVITNKEEWEIASNTWRSILDTVERNERVEYDVNRGTNQRN